MRRLVVAPHADDETMGCGGLLAKRPEECRVVVLAGPDRDREGALRRSMGLLGAKAFEVHRFRDGELPERTVELVTLLDGIMADYRPDEVYLPYPSLHQDHVAAYEAGMRAARMSMHAGHWMPPSVLVYDVAVYDADLYATGLRWNVFEPLTDEQIALKQRACDCYSYDEGDDHPLLSAVQIAAAAGRPRGVAYAERYALVRQVRR